jgi:UPF0271 protein
MAAEDDDMAMAIGRAIKAADPSLLFLVMPGMATARAAERLGLAAFTEIYADRTYDDTFNLTDRAKPGAVIHDVDEAIRHVLRMIGEQAITSVNGKRMPVAIDSVCVHGDNPKSVQLARALRAALEAEGHAVGTFRRP